jgi:hypothetical protein
MLFPSGTIDHVVTQHFKNWADFYESNQSTFSCVDSSIDKFITDTSAALVEPSEIVNNLTLNPTSGIVLCVEDDVSDDSLPPGDGSPPKKEMVAIHHLFAETGFGKDDIRIFGIVGIPRNDNSPLHVVELQTS